MAQIQLVGSLKWNTTSPCMASMMTWPKLVMVSSICTLNVGNGGNVVKNHAKDMWLGPNLWLNFMTSLTLIHTL